MNGQVVYSYKPLPGAEKRIYDKISDITISMKAADHLKMPELVNSEYRVYMEESERAIYDEMCEDLAAQLDKGEVTAANAGVLSGKLCQMANGAIYTDNGDVEHIHDQKLDALEDIIESMNGKPLLVAYWYQHDFDRIEERLRVRKIDFARLDTDASIAKWNRGEIPVALIHPASAGHGPESPERRLYPLLVWHYLEPGTVPADGGAALPAGSGVQDRSRTAHHHGRHH